LQGGEKEEEEEEDETPDLRISCSDSQTAISMSKITRESDRRRHEEQQ
jgi:hypothetical protein